MKTKVVDGLVQFVKKNYKDYDEIKTAELRYGLVGIYNDVTKFIVISILVLILDIFNEMLITLLLFNILRSFGYGLHASKSLNCLLSSLGLFVLGPILIKLITIPIPIKVIIAISCILLFAKNAPADTHERPLIKSQLRLRYKFFTVTFGILFTLALIIINDNFISNAILYAMLIESVMISPLVYKLLSIPYANYKTYVPSTTLNNP